MRYINLRLTYLLAAVSATAEQRASLPDDRRPARLRTSTLGWNTYPARRCDAETTVFRPQRLNQPQ